ncbi:MAG: CRISPR-associated endoribonuclease Cas6, partial [Coriobacteriales bacterium]|nr:CRISPR-associated endoribonuclease Cas6 [Coriobacteriales bacterium]
IVALTSEAKEQIIEPLKALDNLKLKAIDSSFSVSVISDECISLKELTDMIYGCSQSRTTIRFLTPTAFKSAGQYVFMPSTQLLFQNLLMRYFYVFEEGSEPDAETITYLSEHTSIIAYNLRSQYADNIASKGKKIPAFIGSLTLKINGEQTLTGFAQMLLSFGEFAGIGIKTSMGMGAMSVIQKRQ